MTVRLAKLEDMDDIFVLGQQMLNRMYGPGIVKVNTKQGRGDLRSLINNKTGLVIVDRDADGVLLGVLIGQVIRPAFIDMRIANDIAFFVREGYPITAVKLLRRFVYWARQQPNVVEVLVSVSHGLGDLDRLKAIYERLGMKHGGGMYSINWAKEAKYASRAA